MEMRWLIRNVVYTVYITDGQLTGQSFTSLFRLIDIENVAKLYSKRTITFYIIYILY